MWMPRTVNKKRTKFSRTTAPSGRAKKTAKPFLLLNQQRELP